MTTAQNADTLPSRPLDLAAIALTGVIAGGLLGATTNAVNGSVSPLYFVTILGWQDVTDVWRASIAQGLFEGVLIGVFFSLIFATVTGVITRASCPYGFAFKHMVGILLGAYLGWVLGGLAALVLASISPDFYRNAFRGVPKEISPMFRYAWVGGSIWGLELGGLASMILALVVLRANWHRMSRQVGLHSGLEASGVEGKP